MTVKKQKAKATKKIDEVSILWLCHFRLAGGGVGAGAEPTKLAFFFCYFGQLSSHDAAAAAGNYNSNSHENNSNLSV